MIKKTRSLKTHSIACSPLRQPCMIAAYFADVNIGSRGHVRLWVEKIELDPDRRVGKVGLDNDRLQSRIESLGHELEKPDGLDPKSLGAELSGSSIARVPLVRVLTSA